VRGQVYDHRFDRAEAFTTVKLSRHRFGAAWNFVLIPESLDHVTTLGLSLIRQFSQSFEILNQNLILG